MKGIVLATQACKSIVPIVIIPANGLGDRMSGFKDTLKNISHFFKRIEDVVDQL